jgi:hypothetical protein
MQASFLSWILYDEAGMSPPWVGICESSSLLGTGNVHCVKMELALPPQSFGNLSLTLQGQQLPEIGITYGPSRPS